MAKKILKIEEPEIKIDLSDPKNLAEQIAKVMDDKKGFDIVIVDLHGKTIIADYFVIASAKSSTSVKSLAELVDENLSKNFAIEPLRREGMSEGRWVALDYGSVIVHIFHEETRSFYQLEKLWTDGANSVPFAATID